MPPRSRRRGRGRGIRWGMILAVLLAAVAGAWVWNTFGETYPEPDGLEFTVAFQDPGRLSEGHAVRADGALVGVVEGIEPDPESDGWTVRVRLYEEHEGAVAGPADATARVVRRGLVFRRTHLEMVQPGGVQTPVAEGDVLEGLESWAAEQAFRAQHVAERGLRQFRQAAESLRQSALAEVDAVGEQVREWAEGPEGDAVREQLASFRDEVSRIGQEGAGQAREVSRRAIDQGRELMESLRREGREDLADQIRETIGLLEEGEETLDEAEVEIEEPAPEPEEEPEP